MNDYYKILGVPVNATGEQIKRAYREKAKQFHPDVSRAPVSNTRFQLLSEAYQTLIHRDKRRRYDIKLKYGIETRIQDRNREHYKRYGTSNRQGPGTSYHYSFFRSKKKLKQDKKTIFFDNTLFGAMLVIGVFALYSSIFYLLSDNWDSVENGIRRLLFSVTYLTLLIYGWWLYRK